jgi:hypothetical protein
MTQPDSGLVDIVREFLLADRLLRRLFERHARGELEFAEVQELVGDSESSVLFRLKERCHALFRPSARGSGVAMRREALFDLAVGSLFHEAMKFRENLYQRTVYGPKVRALRSEVDPEAGAIFHEFEKILAAAAVRLDEARQETEALLVQTRAQFRMLLEAHRENGLVNRYLIAHAELVDEVFEEKLDGLLATIHGSAAAGYEAAARSYLTSGYFAQARSGLAEAAAHGGTQSELARLADAAAGMEAYLAGDYAEALTRLSAWAAAAASSLPLPADERKLVELAHAAALRIAKLESDEGAASDAAQALARRLDALRAGSPEAATG